MLFCKSTEVTKRYMLDGSVAVMRKAQEEEHNALQVCVKDRDIHRCMPNVYTLTHLKRRLNGHGPALSQTHTHIHTRRV